MSWWINVCDVPLNGNYKLAIAKGMFTMLIFFCLGTLFGWLIPPQNKNSKESEVKG